MLLWELVKGASGGTSGKQPACNAEDVKRPWFNPWVGKIPWRREHSKLLQYSYLENFLDRGAWRATVHRITKGWTRPKQHSMNTYSFVKVGAGPHQSPWLVCEGWVRFQPTLAPSGRCFLPDPGRSEYCQVPA